MRISVRSFLKKPRSSIVVKYPGTANPSRQRQLMRQFEKLVLDTEAHEIFLLWRYRIAYLSLLTM